MSFFLLSKKKFWTFNFVKKKTVRSFSDVLVSWFGKSKVCQSANYNPWINPSKLSWAYFTGRCLTAQKTSPWLTLNNFALRSCYFNSFCQFIVTFNLRNHFQLMWLGTVRNLTHGEQFNDEFNIRIITSTHQVYRSKKLKFSINKTF